MRQEGGSRAQPAQNQPWECCRHGGAPLPPRDKQHLHGARVTHVHVGCCEMRGLLAGKKAGEPKYLWSHPNLSRVWLEVRRNGNPSEQVSREQQAKGEGGEMGKKATEWQ